MRGIQWKPNEKVNGERIHRPAEGFVSGRGASAYFLAWRAAAAAGAPVRVHVATAWTARRAQVVALCVACVYFDRTSARVEREGGNRMQPKGNGAWRKDASSGRGLRLRARGVGLLLGVAAAAGAPVQSVGGAVPSRDGVIQDTVGLCKAAI